MLWREHFEPRTIENVPLPGCKTEALDGDFSPGPRMVMIGGFGFASTADQGVWWRLMQSSFSKQPEVYRMFVSAEPWTRSMRTEAATMVPPSEHSVTLIAYDTTDEWFWLVLPDKPGRGFAALVQGDMILQLVVGPPTEDVWEGFRDSWQRLRT